MLTPDLQEFSRLATGATLLPLAKIVSADLLTPVSAYLSIARNERHAFFLKSVEGGERVRRYTFLGVRPYLVLTARGERIEVRKGKKVSRSKGNIFEAVRQLLSEQKAAIIPGLPPFTSGAVGFFSYDAVRQLEKIGKHAKDDLNLPDCVLMFFDRLLAFDHLRHEIYIIATADVGTESPKKAYERAQQDIVRMEKLLRAGTPEEKRKAKSAPARIKHRTEPNKFLKDVAKVKEYITAGDVFQAVLSQRL